MSLSVLLFLIAPVVQAVCTIPGPNEILVQKAAASTIVSSGYHQHDQQQLASFPNENTLTVMSVSWTVTAVDGNQKIEYDIMQKNSLHVINVSSATKDGNGICIIYLGNTQLPITATITLSASDTKNQNSLVSLIAFSLETKQTENFNAMQLHLENLPADEVMMGMGEQYDVLDLRGALPWSVFTREQGVGRGLQPLTWVLNHLEPFLGGSPRTNYASRPVVISHRGWLYEHENSAYSEFDLSQPSLMSILINESQIPFRGHFACTPGAKSAISLYANLTSLPKMPPAWSYSGAIIGMQGGTHAVLSNLTSLQQLEVPIAAFWLQDWSGARQLTGRQGVAWQWGQWDSNLYPESLEMIKHLKNQTAGSGAISGGIRTLIYVNPMLVDSDIPSIKPFPGQQNPWKTAWERGYFVKLRGETTPWKVYNNASLIDFTNPAAREYYIELMVKSLNTSASGAYTSGGMSDFGECLPLDADLFDKSVSPLRFHNTYPDFWFACVREASRRMFGDENEVFWFGRSAWRKSAGLVNHWGGDQLVSWDRHDGLGSAVASLVTSGLSAAPFTHSDIGGYTNVAAYGIDAYVRSRELFLRWCELAAFSVFFRTHDGADPHLNFQFYRTEEGRKKFARYAKMFNAWLPLRRQLIAAGASNATPVARPLILELPPSAVSCPFPTIIDPLTHYAEASPICNNVRQTYLLGALDEGLLVSPVQVESAVTVNAVFPPNSGEWVYIWNSKTVISSGVNGTQCDISAPIGCPAVFVASKAPLLRILIDNFKAFADHCAETSVVVIGECQSIS